jgi:hypothetical protein
MSRNRGRDQDEIGENAENPQGDHRPHRGRRDDENGREQSAGGAGVFCEM